MKKAKAKTPQGRIALRAARRSWRRRLGGKLSKLGDEGLDLAILGALNGDDKSATVGKFAFAAMLKAVAKRVGK